MNTKELINYLLPSDLVIIIYEYAFDKEYYSNIVLNQLKQKIDLWKLNINLFYSKQNDYILLIDEYYSPFYLFFYFDNLILNYNYSF